MLDKAADWVRADPWRVAALGLAAALLVALAMLLTGPEGTAAAPGPDEASSPTSTSPSTATSVGGTVADQAETGEGDEEPSSPASAGGGFLAVKIDNAPGARPQVGIGTAPLLVEVLVEGGLTRFVAVFPQGASGVVGPIRSLRPVDADLIPAVAVNIVSTGGQPFVIQAVQASGIQRIEPGFFDEFESGRRDPPHDTFLDLDVLMPLISGSQSDADGLPIGELPQVAGAATVIDIPFGSVEYRYEAGRYLRYENGEAFEVLETPDGELLPLVHDILVSFRRWPSGRPATSTPTTFLCRRST